MSGIVRDAFARAASVCADLVRRASATRALALALGLASLTGGCLDELSPDVGPPIVQRCDPEDTDPETDVSFRTEILALFARPSREGGCACHNPGGVGRELGGLDLSSYGTLLRGGRGSGRDIVVPGDPCVSVLYLKTGEAPPFGGRMPLSGPPYLSDEERRLIHDWIAEGAHEN